MRSTHASRRSPPPGFSSFSWVGAIYLLSLINGVRLMETSKFNQNARILADRHYSRQSVGNPQFIGPGRSIVLVDCGGRVVFGWRWQLKDRLDGRVGYECCIFRNESSARSSDLVLEAEAYAVAKWGPGPAFTYVDPVRVASSNPGYCFKCAGWEPDGHSKSGLLCLVKDLKS